MNSMCAVFNHSPCALKVIDSPTFYGKGSLLVYPKLFSFQFLDKIILSLWQFQPSQHLSVFQLLYLQHFAFCSYWLSQTFLHENYLIFSTSGFLFFFSKLTVFIWGILICFYSSPNLKHFVVLSSPSCSLLFRSLCDAQCLRMFSSSSGLSFQSDSVCSSGFTLFNFLAHAPVMDLQLISLRL